MAVLGNRYEVLDSVGRGAAAVVYKVRDRRDDTHKVAKLLHAQSAKNPETVRRFEDEFRILRGLHHPSLPQVYDYGWTDDQSRFMVMEYVEGRPLDQYIADRPQDLWVILYQLCEVLTFIHSHNLLHQDIKPGNILVKRTSAYGEEMPLCMLIDFGLTYRRDGGDQVAMVGTPEYMAPEVIVGDTPLTRAVDYYSLGVSLYQLITGELPFTGTGRDIFDGHLNKEVRFKREKIEHAELYPHIRGLMTKDKRARLEAFEDFKRAVIGRMTGGIDELEQAYGLARINSLGMIGKDEVWNELMEWLDGVHKSGESDFSVMVLRGASGSGTSYLGNRLGEEGRIAGIVVVEGGPNVLCQTDASFDPDGYWAFLSEGSSPTVLVIFHDYDSFGTDEKELLDYLSRRHAAEIAVGSPPRMALVIPSNDPEAAVRVAESMSNQVKVHDCSILPLTEQDQELVVHMFRGNILDGRDAEEIRRMLSESAPSADAVLRSLQNALLSNALTFSSGRWTVQVALRGLSPSTGNYFAAIAANLPTTARNLAYIISCVRTRMSLSMLASSSGLAKEEILQELSQLIRLGLVSVTHGSEEGAVGYASDAVKQQVRESMDVKRIRVLNRQLLKLVTEELGDEVARGRRAELYGDAATHAAASGEFRCAMRFLLRGLVIADDDLNLRLIRDLVDCGYHICGQHAEVGVNRPNLLRRYLTRTLLKAYMRHGMHDGIHGIVRDEYGGEVERVPTSFVPICARSLIHAGASQQAAELLEERMQRLPVMSQPYLHMLVERAMVKRDAAKPLEGIADLDNALRFMRRMTFYYRCRTYLHYALCYDAMGAYEKIAHLVEKAEVIAREFRLMYELSVVLQTKANVEFAAHRLPAAMSYISEGVRLTSTHNLDNSRKWFYFQASAVYYERGDLSRCARYLGYALSLARRLGDLDTTVVGLVRMAMIAQERGEYGNAIKQLERADRIASRMKGYIPRRTLNLVKFHLYLDLNLSNIDREFEALRSVMNSEAGKHRRGQFHLLAGHYWRHRGKGEESADNYREAIALFDQTGQEDDRCRAAVALGGLGIALENMKLYEEGDRVAVECLEKIESEALVAEHAVARLEHAIAVKKDVQHSAHRCEELLDSIVTTLTRLRANGLLYKVWVELSEPERAEAAFRRFYRETRRVIANLPSEEMSRGFLARRNVAETLGLYRATRRH